MKALKVLSLFDGISCGMVALERAGIPVERYVAYEIEEDAIKVSKHNYPQIEHKGDVFKAEYTEGEFDILIGGSPCTYWSIAKAGYGRETTSSGMGFELFMQYVRALKEAKPKYFLYENNDSISKEIKEEITKQLGVDYVMIDSADFSAQHRKRYYWTNIPIDEWQKNPVLFKDIMETEGNFKYRDFSKFADTVKISKDGLSVRYDTSGKGHYGQGNRAKKPNQKWNTLPAAGSNTKNDIWVDEYVGRHLLPVEMERLQTLPDGYTSCLNSDIKSMRCCGNGWTVDVIAHIFTYIKKAKENNKMELKIYNPTEEGFIKAIEWNHEEIKNEVAEKVKHYANLVYTEDQIKEAKSDRATLNKFVKALEDKRKEIKKQCLEPYERFEKQMKEIIAIVNEPIAMIDSQVKGYEEQKKAEKLEKIKEYFNEKNTHEFLTLDMIIDSKWLNASTSMKSIQDAIDAGLLVVAKDIATLSTLPEFGFEATKVYKTSLDVSKAISEAKRMSDIAKAKAEAEKQEEVAPEAPIRQAIESIDEQERQALEQCNVEQPKQWVAFSALLSTEDAVALKEFFNSRNIEFKAI